MNMAKLNTWSGSLHLTFRLLPQPSPNLRPFLSAHGLPAEEVLALLPYHRERAPDQTRQGPDPKRYRDGKQVYQTVGLLYEGPDSRIHVTALGKAALRWLDIIHNKNRIILARHAAFALAACQLCNPTGAGRKYDESMIVFPFAFIWKAMLALEGKINSDELNRSIFKTKNHEDLLEAIDNIKEARRAGDVNILGNEIITGKAKNDRIIPWMSLASFGWILFPDKRGAENSTYYEFVPDTLQVVKEASRVVHKHRGFESVTQYVEYISQCAALPEDLR
jgi:hypothetical protein